MVIRMQMDYQNPYPLIGDYLYASLQFKMVFVISLVLTAAQ